MSISRIEKVAIYRLEIELDYTYEFSCGRSLSSIDSTIVEITTADGLTGWGEACPCGNNYLPNYPAGIRAGSGVIAPELIGENPLHIQKLYDRMEWLLPAHAYVKAAIDMACWDVLGKSPGLGVVPVPAVIGDPVAEFGR